MRVLPVPPHRRGPRVTRCALGFAALLAACSSSDSTPDSPTPPVPARPGAVAGQVVILGGPTGLGVAPVTLRRTSGDSVAAALTDSAGRFAFADIPAGAYRVAVRLRAGFRADAAADTSQAVTVSSGGTASVQLTARPVQDVVDSMRPGRTDTVTLASGVRLAVSVPTGTAPIPVRMRAGPTDAASWNGRTVLGPSAELLISGVAPADSTLVSFELPLSASGPALEGAAVRAFYLLPNGDSLSLSNLDAVIGTRQDPVSGQARTALLGVAPLSIAGSWHSRRSRGSRAPNH